MIKNYLRRGKNQSLKVTAAAKIVSQVMQRSLDFAKNVTESTSDCKTQAAGQRVYSTNLNIGAVSQLSGPH